MQTDRITRAAWHEATFGVPPRQALERADRELDIAAYWTPWELLGSAYVVEWLADYMALTDSTVQ